MTTKESIRRVFRAVKYQEGFTCFLLGLGFRRAKEGIRKKVYVSPRHNFVVKLARPGVEYYPRKGSKIGKFYLWPEKCGTRRIQGRPWQLQFQPKCDTRGRVKIFNRLEGDLFKANTAWRCDAHEGNVALYRGKPVIIDY